MQANLRHLRSFREVARHGSLSAAARAVHISQPAVTLAIAGLERYFDAPLLLRRSTGVALTKAGEICLVRIERIELRGAHQPFDIGDAFARRPARNVGKRFAQLVHRALDAHQADFTCLC